MSAKKKDASVSTKLNTLEKHIKVNLPKKKRKRSVDLTLGEAKKVRKNH